MILSAFLQSVEFYVIAAVVAAGIVGVCVRPARKQEAVSHLLAGYLENEDPSAPSIALECEDDGTVQLERRGLPDVTDMGAVSLAVTVIGTDVTIEERIVTSDGAERRNTAIFRLDFLPFGRYHVCYRSEPTGLFTAFSLANRPGLRIMRELAR